MGHGMVIACWPAGSSLPLGESKKRGSVSLLPVGSAGQSVSLVQSLAH